MDHNEYAEKHIKNHHLTYGERVVIEVRFNRDHWSANKIAKEIGCCANTIRNELNRGAKYVHYRSIKRYDAKLGQQKYEEYRLNCHRPLKLVDVMKFINYFVDKFINDKWSPDACIGYVKKHKLFNNDELVCTKTLYNYIDHCYLMIRNIDLNSKLKRKEKAKLVKKYKRMLGRSIEERADNVELRDEFGHWELDLVIGSNKDDDKVLMTLLERKTRMFFTYVIPDKKPESVMKVFDDLKDEYEEMFDIIFKTITTDNGLEFSNLSDLEKEFKTLIYYAHPFSSYEKGSIERHNGILRNFIPKGKRIDDYSLEEISNIELIINGIPRKLLNYSTPEELFDDEVDKIYKIA